MGGLLVQGSLELDSLPWVQEVKKLSLTLQELASDPLPLSQETLSSDFQAN